MDWGPAALPRTIMIIDVESYGDLARTDRHRVRVRDGVYRVLRTAFDEAAIPWPSGRRFSTGDGMMIVLPPDVPKIGLVDRLPDRMAAGLRRHNGDHSDGARIRLRVALHAGEVREDGHGFLGEAVNFTFRIVDAQAAKLALKASSADFVLIVSDWYYRSVVVNDPAALPAGFQQIDVANKETRVKAWMRLVGGSSGPGVPPAPAITRGDALAELGKIVDVLLDIPAFAAREDRDLVLGQLDHKVTSSIPRYSTARADIISIVRTCQRYPGAWNKLIEAIRFFAGGSDAMNRLDSLVAESGR